jgi:glycerol-3-phosphate dehydrogenase
VTGRRDALERLARETFDLVVVGGGITGAGIARDAAMRGLEVALVERGDFASGTSSQSSKLVHGGLRYLQQAQLKLVFEGTNERALLMRLAPHLVRPIEFLVPAYHRGYLAMISTGLLLYDLLALGKPPAGHRRLGARELSQLEPALRRERLCGGLSYHDCATDDSRLVLENVLGAVAAGAVCANYVRATGLRGTDRARGIACEDTLTGDRFDVRARVVVGALGPFTDSVLAELGVPPPAPLLRPTKGVHILVDRDRLPVRRAVTMLSRDRRVVFCIPSGPRTIVGTTDTDDVGDDPAAVTPTLEDVLYLLATANFYFPDARLRADDVRSTYAGLRPLIAQGGAASNMSREHELVTTRTGMILIVGGKLTTYRRMAREAVDRALERLSDMGFGESARPCRTAEVPLPGALEEGRSLAGEAARLAERYGLPADVAKHLAEAYGRRAHAVLGEAPIERIDPELPYLWSEVDHAIAEEAARTVTDVLRRRVPLFLHAIDQGLGVAAEVARRLGAAHGYPDDERARQERAYAAEVARSRAFLAASMHGAATAAS